jgi:hypothetical protein
MYKAAQHRLINQCFIVASSVGVILHLQAIKNSKIAVMYEKICQ